MIEKDPNRHKEKGFAIPFFAHRFPKTPINFHTHLTCPLTIINPME